MAGSNNCYLHFQYLPQYQVLYCSATSCKYCLTPGKSLHWHFNEEHDIKGSCKKELVEWIETLILIKPTHYRQHKSGRLVGARALESSVQVAWHAKAGSTYGGQLVDE